MPDDPELLRRYAEEGSRDAFDELARRHLGLVYSAALRQTGGDVHLAKDVTQMVLIDLARKAGKLKGSLVLVGWLHTATRYAAMTVARSERSRKARETATFVLEPQTSDDGADPGWERLKPVLDESLGELQEAEREVVLLRYFKGFSYAAIGLELSLTETAARSRADRALERLRVVLARRGITSTAAALANALVRGGTISVPPEFATTAISAALSIGIEGAAVLPGGLVVMKTSSALLPISVLGGMLFVTGFFAGTGGLSQLFSGGDQDRSVVAPTVPVTPLAMATRAEDSKGTALQQEPQTSVSAEEMGLRMNRLRDAGEFLTLEKEFRAWAGRDRREALKWATTLDPKQGRGTAITWALQVWMTREPAEAIGWAREAYPDFLNSGQFVEAVVATGNIAFAEETILRLPAGPERSALTRVLTTSWAKLDPAFISHWVKERFPPVLAPVIEPDGTGSFDSSLGMAASGVLRIWAKTDPQAALEWAQELGGNIDDRGMIISALASGWIQGGGIEAAKSYFSNAPNLDENNFGYVEIIKAVAVEHPEEVIEWVDRATPSRRGGVVASAIEAVQERRPDLAAQLALKVSADPNRIASALQRILPRWSTRDPAASSAFLEGVSQLAPDVREKLRSSMVQPTKAPGGP